MQGLAYRRARAVCWHQSTLRPAATGARSHHERRVRASTIAATALASAAEPTAPSPPPTPTPSQPKPSAPRAAMTAPCTLGQSWRWSAGAASRRWSCPHTSAGAEASAARTEHAVEHGGAAVDVRGSESPAPQPSATLRDSAGAAAGAPGGDGGFAWMSSCISPCTPCSTR